jgi:glycosyltransferase involved in cell wall biosynthesis
MVENIPRGLSSGEISSLVSGGILKFLALCDYSLTYTAGAQTAFFREVEALLAAGHQVLVVGSDSDRAALPVGAQFRHHHKKRFRVPPINFPVFVNNQRLKDFFQEIAESFKPDAVLCHSEYGLAVTACDVFQPRKVPVLFIVHSFFITVGSPLPWPKWLAKLLIRLTLKMDVSMIRLAKGGIDNALQNATLAFSHKADIVISPSHHQAQSMLNAGTKDVRVLSNVTDVEHSPLPMPDYGVLKLVWVGRFAPEKRLDVALDAVRLAKSELNRIGIGAEKLELHVLGGEAKHDPIAIWHGKVPPAEVGEIMSNCHAVTMTSYNFDNQPMVILEALAQGRPVVLSDPKLAREFEGAAILAEDHTAEGLARTLVSLVQDQTQLTGFAKKAVELSHLSSGKNHVGEILKLVSEVRSRH